MNRARGKFITFEGGEGTGKSTQAQLLKEKLQARGHRIVLTREPGGSPGAEEIRKLVVEGQPERWTPLTETLLFLAARSDHVSRLIEPSLHDGAWVVSDRFSDSTLVYQGVARGLGIETIRNIQQASLGTIVPDLTLVLDLPPEEGLSRAQGRHADHETRFEKFDAGFHARLRGAFRDIVIAEPERCILIDGGQAPDLVAADVWRAVEEKLQP